jgi:hypothetical protein
MVSQAQADLWTLVLDRPLIASKELAEALRREVHRQPLDFRTRLLIRDSLAALGSAWGEERFSRWFSAAPEHDALDDIRRSSLGPAGFPSLIHRTVEPTQTDKVLQFLRELGQALPKPATIAAGGSIALMLAGVLTRRTEAIDIIDEVPIEIRSEHELLNQLAKRYALQLTRFQSHYLPTGWASRLKSFGMFGRLEVQLVDEYDVTLSKVFSAREKDRDDFRILVPVLDKQVLTRRLIDTTKSLQQEEQLRRQAEKNWYIVFGEPLPK